MSKKHIEFIGKSVSGLCVTAIVLLVVTLVFMVAQHGLATFFVDGISPVDFFCGTTWNLHQADANGNPTVGALPMIVGSFAVTLLSTVIALPFAIGSAIFVVEISPKFGRTVFQPIVELLVGIPSVVYGLIGLTVVVAWCRGWSNSTGFGIFAGSLVLAVMILPTITSLSIDALTAVPKSYREGAYGVGASRWQTIWHVVLRGAGRANGYRQRSADARWPVHAGLDIDQRAYDGHRQRNDGYRVQRCAVVVGTTAAGHVVRVHLYHPFHRAQRRVEVQ